MPSCNPFPHKKHSVFIINCYPPVKENSEVPHSSELSYLTFYASANPAKLTKVGSFIQKKVEKDIRKNRKSQNIVSLKIIRELIRSCHRDLNIFSKYIVRIIENLLLVQDLDILDSACETFVLFCENHDGSALGVDLEFTNDYERLVSKFASFSVNADGNGRFSLRKKYAGHRSIQAIIKSSAFQTSTFRNQINIIFPPLINTIGTSDEAVKILRSRFDNDFEISIDNTGLSMSGAEVNSVMIEMLASQTISLLFATVNGPYVRLSLAPLFDYLDKKSMWGPPELPLAIMKLALESVQPRFKYLLVSDVLSQLNLLNQTERPISDKKYFIFVMLLDFILNSRIHMKGISVLEVLESIFGYLSKHNEIYKNSGDQNQLEIQKGLLSSIRGLTSQVYYENQSNDMLSFLISKINTENSNELSLVILCMEQVIQGPNSSLLDDSDKVNIMDPGITLNIWQPSLILFVHADPIIRIRFCQCFYRFLSNYITKDVIDSKNRPIHSFDCHNNMLFVTSLIRAFYEWVLLPNFNFTDLSFFYSFLCLLNRKFGVDASALTVSFSFKIQELLINKRIEGTERQLAIHSAIISWFITTARLYQTTSLINYMVLLRRQEIHLDEELDSTVLNSNTLEPKMFYGPSCSTEDIDWFDRDKVVRMISADPLNDEQDPEGRKLETKLSTEWGYDAFLIDDGYDQIRIENENKPQLFISTRYSLVEPTMQGNMRESINVETLKKALVNKDNYSHLKKEPITPLDLDSLFNELNINRAQPSSTSLIYTPL